MQPKPSMPMIHASIASTLLDFLDDAGAPLDSGLEAAGMPTRLAEDRSGYVPVATYCHWVDRQAREQGVDNLGLLAVDRAGIDGLLPGLVNAILASPNLYAGLQTFANAAYRESSQVSIWLDESGDKLRLCHRGSYPRSMPGQPDMSWWVVGIFIHVIRLFLGPTWHPDYMGVPAQGRGLVIGAELFPETRLIADPEIVWIPVARHLLNTPPVTAGKQACLVPAPGDLPAPPATLDESLMELITLYLPDGPPRIDAAAKAANLSVRTLQRRLASRNLTYEQLVSNLRFGHARTMLEQQDLPVTEIARRLGYSDSAHFARAFRRIAGVSPRAYRADCRG